MHREDLVPDKLNGVYFSSIFSKNGIVLYFIQDSGYYGIKFEFIKAFILIVILIGLES